MRLLTVLIGNGFSLLICFAVFVESSQASEQKNFPGDNATFCSQAQALIAQTDAAATNIIHDDYETFVESKANPFPLETQQFYSSPASSAAQLPTVVSCKMRTAGSIADAFSAAGETVVTGEDKSCDFIAAEIVDGVRKDISPDYSASALRSVRVDDEELTFMGPMWLDPWPFQSAYRDEADVIHLKSRALYVPWSIFIPAPAAFKGVYYCHLPSPAYVKALLLGQVQAPLESQ